MNTSRSIRSMNQFVYGYPVELRFDNKSPLEYFVTFDKPNLFIEPYDNLWIKLAATFIFLLGLLGSSVQFSFIVYEACGYAASYRTAINQLVSSSYFVVSRTSVPQCLKITEKVLFNVASEACYIYILSDKTSF